MPPLVLCYTWAAADVGVGQKPRLLTGECISLLLHLHPAIQWVEDIHVCLVKVIFLIRNWKLHKSESLTTAIVYVSTFVEDHLIPLYIHQK